MSFFVKAARQLVCFARKTVVETFFERRYGVDTAHPASLEEFELDAESRVEYRPSGWTTIRRVLPRSTVSADDVFIDFGSGKGRVVLQAAQYPFARVIGVELSAQLTEIAKDNVERRSAKLQCRNIELVTTDVLDYELPDDITVAFFYNPFVGSIFSTVIKRLIESVDRNPRSLRIIYRNPEEEEFLLSTGRVRVVHAARGRANAAPIGVYEIVPGEPVPERRRNSARLLRANGTPQHVTRW